MSHFILFCPNAGLFLLGQRIVKMRILLASNWYWWASAWSCWRSKYNFLFLMVFDYTYSWSCYADVIYSLPASEHFNRSVWWRSLCCYNLMFELGKWMVLEVLVDRNRIKCLWKCLVAQKFYMRSIFTGPFRIFKN